MKHFIAAVVLIVISIIVVIANSIIIVHKMNKLIDSLAKLPSDENGFLGDEEITETSSQIYEEWLDQTRFISLSVDSEEISDITLLLADLEKYCQQSDFEMYQITLQRVIILLEELREAEKPLLKSLV